jgi:hypothetical protein
MPFFNEVGTYSAGGEMIGRWQRTAGKYTFFYGMGDENHELVTVVRKSYRQLRRLSSFVTGCNT